MFGDTTSHKQILSRSQIKRAIPMARKPDRATDHLENCTFASFSQAKLRKIALRPEEMPSRDRLQPEWYTYYWNGVRKPQYSMTESANFRCFITTVPMVGQPTPSPRPPPSLPHSHSAHCPRCYRTSTSGTTKRSSRPRDQTPGSAAPGRVAER